MEEEKEQHWLQAWFSIGDIITLLVMLAMFAFGYGQLKRDVQMLQEDVTQLSTVQITPGAATRITSLETSMMWLQTSIQEDRKQSAEFRAETRAQLARIEAALTAHATNK